MMKDSEHLPHPASRGRRARQNPQIWASFLNKYVSPLAGNISEVTVACLVTMVQGNVLAIGVGHLMLAFQTGLTAGTAATIAVLLAKPHKRGFIALILGVMTTVADYLLHPGMFGSVFTEAIVTGVGAAILSYAVSKLGEVVRRRKERTAH
jgi:hypothetical protein